MNAGRFVGRVGGLAVALGVGVAVAHGTPAAWADDTGSTSTGDSPAAGGAQKPASMPTAAVQDKPEPSERQVSPRTTLRAGVDRSGDDAASAVQTPKVKPAAGTHRLRPGPVRKGAVATRPLTATAAPEPGPPESTSPAGDPKTPVDSPLQSALLAVGARSRPLGESAVQDTFGLADSAPTAPVQPVGTPDPLTGAVTGKVDATDPGGDTLSYAVTSEPTKGTVALNGQSGMYTYVPTPAARIVAGTTPTADTDSFTVAVSDGGQSSPAPVSVYVSPIKFETQASIAVGTNPTAMVTTTDGRMFVLNTASKSVSVINTVTGKRIDANSSWFSKDIGVGAAPGALVLSPDGKRLYVANGASNSVSVIDTATYKAIDANPSAYSKTIAVGKTPSALAMGTDGRLYVANAGSNTVSVIDVATNTLIDVDPDNAGTQSIPVGTSPSAMAFGADGRLYVANRGDNTLSVLDGAAVTDTIAIGVQPSSVALGPGGRVYVTNAGSSTVSIVDPNTLGVQQISVGPSPSSIAFSPNGGLGYVANANDTISVIDIATSTVIHTLAIDTDTTGGHAITVGAGGTIYVTDAADKTVRVVTVRFGNAAPVSGVPTVGTPNSGNGAVSGALGFTDRDGDNLSYSVTAPSTGTVGITAAGVYTFTPSVAARQAAAAGGPKSTSFTVTATDGQASTAVSVLVPIAAPVAATRVSSLGTVSVPGWQVGPGPLWTPDGTRALIVTTVYGATTSSTRVAVVNTATGKQIGGTLTLSGAPGSPVLNADGSRALITTSVHDTTTGIATNWVSVIDTATGKQIGTTAAISGNPSGSALDPDGNAATGSIGSHALMTTRIQDAVTGSESTQMVVVDTLTGAQVGTPLTLAGAGYSQLTAGDTHALLTTTEGSSAAGFTTHVGILDMMTGAPIGSVLTLDGDGSVVQSADGRRALITVSDRDADNRDVARIAVIDTTTGTTTFTPLVLSGQSTFGSLLSSPDGSRALIVTNVYDGRTSVNTARVAMIDTATGIQIGTTTSLTGFTNGGVLFSADAQRAVITTISSNFATTGKATTEVAVINTLTGSRVGTTFTLNDDTGQALLSDDGSRALINTGAQLMVINTATGTRAGSIISGGSNPQFSADGTRVLITTGNNPTRVTVLQIV